MKGGGNELTSNVHERAWNLLPRGGGYGSKGERSVTQHLLAESMNCVL